MARSGTSATARVLSLCGGALPEGMLGAMRDNPLGHWESRATLQLNDKLLQRNNSGWYDPTIRLQEKGEFEGKEYAACITEIRAFLATLPAAPLVVLKDPKITVLSGMWFEAARLSGFDVATVIAVRHPQEVVASITAPGGISAELSSALWLKYTLLAERGTRAVPRVFVEYANLLNDWRREVKRISAALAIDLDAQDESAIEEFLTPNLHRQRHQGPVIEPFGTSWFSTVYEDMRAAARDEPWEQSALDLIFDGYRASERTFRAASADFRRLRRVNRLLRPSITKLNYEVRAMVNRRRGTWA
ncbi:sulfotransferase family protein [Mycolicibacterium tusciae]|nr:sulfotransferase family protein [Mycolicibacterium tusciae]